ncbi:MAG: putative rane protein [Herbinix sp.]|jgi:hypothetical protein|nr:putative rane protein [Herbinix sp.]
MINRYNKISELHYITGFATLSFGQAKSSRIQKGEFFVQYCENCKVSLKGNNHVCPLCGGIPQGEGEEEEEVFPHIPTIYQEFNLFIRIILMLSLSVVVISIALNAIFTKESRWSLFVAAGILCMWISLFFILRKRNNIPKTIVWQVLVLGVLSVIWDYSMGWRQWSIDYVIPTICVGAMIVMAIAAKILKIGVRDLIIYLLVDGIFGFVPIIFLLFGGLNVRYPSVICVAVSAISLLALIVFEGDNMKTEINKRMHI